MNQLRKEDLIMPYFVVAGKNRKEKINSMPGVFRFSSDKLIHEIKELKPVGVDKILLFGIAEHKDARAGESYSENGAVQNAVFDVKNKIKGITVITDVCLCAFTRHGHCRILKSNKEVDNQATLAALARIAVSHAKAGADMVAPSAVMDGQVKAIRKALDKNGYKKTKILGYSAKFASSFYGPFRDALDSAPQFGDRTGYQLDYKNPEKALKRIGREIKEGADMVMVKPALAYLDIIYQAKKRFKRPLAAYNVSGEYSLTRGNPALALEVLHAIKRAGADLIITYFAKEAAGWLKKI